MHGQIFQFADGKQVSELMRVAAILLRIAPLCLDVPEVIACSRFCLFARHHHLEQAGGHHHLMAHNVSDANAHSALNEEGPEALPIDSAALRTSAAWSLAYVIQNELAVAL
jgi:hypothetical protein